MTGERSPARALPALALEPDRLHVNLQIPDSGGRRCRTVVDDPQGATLASGSGLQVGEYGQDTAVVA